MMWSLKSSSEYLFDYPWYMLFYTMVVSYVALLAYTIILLFKLVDWSVPSAYKNVRKTRILLYSVLPIIAWSMYLIAYYPGTMTPDSLSHWEQIHTHDFSNWHPVVYTWYIMGLTSIWKSPAIVAFSQIIILAIFAGYAGYSIEKRGMPVKWVWVGVVLFSLYPLNGIFPVAIWKDIFFSGFLFLYTILIFNIVSSRGRWLGSNRNTAILMITSLAICLMRSNGLPIFIVIGISLLFAYLPYYKRLLVTLLVVGASYFMITGPFFDYMDVTSTSPNEALSIPTQQIAHIIKEDGELTTDQKEYLNKILPLELWKKNYNPYLTDDIKFDAHYDHEVIFKDFGKYLSTWASIVSNNFGLAVEAYLDQTSIIWQINQPEDGYTSTYARNLYLYNDYNLKTNPLNDTIYKFYNDNLVRVEMYLKEVVLRPAVYTGIILLTVAALAIKTGGRSLLIVLPVLLNSGTMLLATPAQDFRYQFANVLTAFFMVGIVFIKYNSSQKKVEHE
ncbi:DUF6020 family protein [Halobacillus yeomjeoni]|uniref:DUF6020 family protein n=1 Tax=Halobacillus yeomjeoni TaxID=311194 RepID=UPI001CD6939B|nr:DUF6020 family protein [Halobacillus yeomjeoni]MCA0985525.1 DUF6020 family protein [Halobacillus yeomjeoni]